MNSLFWHSASIIISVFLKLILVFCNFKVFPIWLQEVDIWSYGCLLLELLTLQVPYMGLSELEIHDLIQVSLSLSLHVSIYLSISPPVCVLCLRKRKSCINYLRYSDMSLVTQINYVKMPDA